MGGDVSMRDRKIGQKRLERMSAGWRVYIFSFFSVSATVALFVLGMFVPWPVTVRNRKCILGGCMSEKSEQGHCARLM